MDNSTLKVSHNDREKHSALTGKKGELIDHREISKEERFHSFIFCRTVLPALAQKMPYYVPTKDNQIVTSQSKSSYEFNCASDCVSYLFWGKKLVLAQGAWLKAFLESREIELLQKNEFVRFSECKVSKQFQFAYYKHLQGDFVSIIPKYLTKYDCLILQCEDCEIAYKTVDQFTQSQHANSQTRYYHYSSEYALLSDIHFLNSFVRGYREIGCYRRQRNVFKHVIDKSILATLQKLYLSPKL